MLVVIDVQEAFRKAVPAFGDVAARTAILVQGAEALGVPVLVTEQYPRGLGDTVPEVADHLGDTPRLPKTAFSAARAEGFDLGGRDQALVCGIEAHVCVAQTVLDLLAARRRRAGRARRVRSRTDADRDTACTASSRRARRSRASRSPCSNCSAQRAPPSSRPSRS